MCGRRQEGVDLVERGFELFCIAERFCPGRLEFPHAFADEHLSILLDDGIKVRLLPIVRFVPYEPASPRRIRFDPFSASFPTCRSCTGRRVEQAERMPQEEGLLVRVEVVGQDGQGWMWRVGLDGRERASAAAGSPHGARH
jgi:hypothetical protein